MERNDRSLGTRELAPTQGSLEGAETESPTGSRAAATTVEPSPTRRVDDPDSTPRSASDTSLDPDGPRREESSSDPLAQPGVDAEARSESEQDPAGPLLATSSTGEFQRRWEEVQTRFVDEPRRAVQDADGLVATVMQQLAEGFAQERERLEAHWDRGEDISTEDLRVALQRYRSFFHRLLST